MAGHYKKPGYKPTTSIALDEELFVRLTSIVLKRERIIVQLRLLISFLKGLKYEALLQKKREKVSGL
jgi:hypothetical protein